VRILLTGATGFVGSHLAEALVARGHAVVALARRPESYAVLEALGATPAPGSLEDAGSLDGALEGVGAVIHAAGLTAAASEAEFLAVNEGGTRRLLEAVARRAPSLRRFVLVSSQAALGPSKRGTPLEEDAECRPVTAYGRSKLAAERAVRERAVPWTIVRPPPVYGPRDREFLRLFRIVRRGIAPVFGTGAQELCFVYVTDLAEAIARAVETPAAAGRIYHAAHPQVVLSRDFTRAVGRAIGRRPLLVPVPAILAWPIVALIGRAAAAAGRRTVVNTDKMAEFLAPSWLMAVDRAARELGWQARTGLEAGLARTAAWYGREGWLR